MATTAPPPVRLDAQQAPAQAMPKAAPITWWAIAGTAFLALEAYIMVRWVTGPHLETVRSGPSQPPSWMKVVLVSWQIAGVPAGLAMLWHFLGRPWRAERRIASDGLICIALFLVCWQDPLSAYFGNWFTYNSYLLNVGSWVNDIPGWVSYGAPGQQIASPILWLPFFYIYVFFTAALVGCWGMRRVHARFPHISQPALVGVGILTCAAFDFVVEGFLFLPLGFYTYAGGHLAIFGDTYHKFPLQEAIGAGVVCGGIACLRYFKDDQGRTVVERGVDRLAVSDRRKAWLRFAAICGIVNVILLAYNVPMSVLGAHSTEWPADIQQRSYLTDYLCGPGTDRACPGPKVPLRKGAGSAYATRDGRLGGAVPPGPTTFKTGR